MVTSLLNKPDAPLPLTATRNHGLDNLRTFLTVLVILHHTAIAYGGSGGWLFRSQCFPSESVILVTFNAINQTSFMALFFWMSGYFTRMAMSKGRASRSAIIRTRLLRILLPAIGYTMLIEPTLHVLLWTWTKVASNGETIWQYYVYYWMHVDGIKGPVWYLALGMIFDVIAFLFLWRSGEDSTSKVQGDILHEKKPFWAPIAWIITILSSFTIRLVFPVGEIWPLLSLQLAYLPQYILAYFGGHFSFLTGDPFLLLPFKYDTNNAWRKLFHSLGRTLLDLVLLTMINETVLGLDRERSIQLARGGFNFPALGYEIWNELGFATIGFALIALFLTRGDFKWNWGNMWISRYSYGAFLLHPLVSLFIEFVVEGLMGCQEGDDTSKNTSWSVLGPVLLTVVMGGVNVVASWAAAWAFVSVAPFVGTII